MDGEKIIEVLKDWLSDDDGYSEDDAENQINEAVITIHIKYSNGHIDKLLIDKKPILKLY